MKLKCALKFVLMAVVLCCGCFWTAGGAKAEDAGEMRYVPEEQYWTYKAAEDESGNTLEDSIILTEYHDNTEVGAYDYDTPCCLVIPEEIQGKKVVGIEIEQWYAHYRKIVSVEIPNTVTSIDFEEFFYLEHLTLPDSIKYINRRAFFECSHLEEINIPEGVVEIGSYAFYGCRSLKKISLPASLEEVSDETYNPETVFADCRSLQEIKVAAGNKKFYDRDGVLFMDETYTDYIDTGEVDEEGDPIQDEIVKQYRTIIAYPAGKSGEFTIEEDMTPFEPAVAFLNAAGLTAIHVDPGNLRYVSIDGILYSRDMEFLYACPAGKTGDLTVPDGVKTIDTNAFSCSSLRSLVISDSVQRVWGYQFHDSTNIKSIHFGKSLENLITVCNLPSLETVSISQDNQNFAVVDNVIYDKQLSEMLDIPGGFTGKLTIPDSVSEISVFISNSDSDIKISEMHLGKNIGVKILTTKGDEENDPELNRRIDELLSASEVFTVSEENTELKAVDGTLYTADMTALIAAKKTESLVIPDGVTTIYTDGIRYVTKTMTIPQSVVNFWGGSLYWLDTICGYTGSAAEEYADKCGITFTALTDQPDQSETGKTGDINQDGKIDGKDISMLLQYRLNKRELTEAQIAAGDVYKDGKIDGKDVSKLLQYRLGKISSLD